MASIRIGEILTYLPEKMDLDVNVWCPLSDSNRPPTDYKSVALPDELKGHQLHYKACAHGLRSGRLVANQRNSIVHNSLNNLSGIKATFHR